MAAKKTFKTPTEAFISDTDKKGSDPDKITLEQGFQVPEGYRLVKESKTKRMQLLVTPTTYDHIKTAADLAGVSMNEMCNRVFNEYLKGEK